MIVRWLLIILLIRQDLAQDAASQLTIKQSRPSEYHYYESVKAKFIDDFDFLENKVRTCISDVFKAHMEIPEAALKVECVGRYNELLHYVYNKQLRRLKRAFFNLVVKNLEPFRCKYEDEIVYFLYILNFLTSRDLRIKNSLVSITRTTKYQVHPRRFNNLVQILNELLDDFEKIQFTIVEKRTQLVIFMERQISNRDKYLIELEVRRQELEERDIDSHDIA